ncbi:MAG: glycerate kinase [Francisella endosymbiont of Hyalomma asiaticum]
MNGAILTFGKQNGVADKQLKDIDDKILSVAKLSQKITNKNLDNLLSTGAAGGVGFTLATFINSQSVSGSELILDTINFDNYLKNCKIGIVGEGKMDQQSLYGKIPITVAKRAKKYNVKKVIAM